MSVALERLQRAPIWKYLRHWVAENPDFLWAPTGGAASFEAAIGGQHLYPVNQVSMGPGGIKNPADNQTTGPMLRFNDVFGLTASSNFVVLMLVSGTSAASRGHLFKIGNSTTGIGVGHGHSSDSGYGTKIMLLREGLAWHASGDAAWVDGLNAVSLANVVSGGYNADAYPLGANASASTQVPNSPSGQSYINGRNDTIGSPFKVHAVALWKRTFTTVDNEYQNWRAAQLEPISELYRLPREYIDSLFIPREQIVVTSAVASAPTISDLRAINVTSNSAQWSIDYSFS